MAIPLKLCKKHRYYDITLTIDIQPTNNAIYVDLESTSSSFTSSKYFSNLILHIYKVQLCIWAYSSLQYLADRESCGPSAVADASCWNWKLPKAEFSIYQHLKQCRCYAEGQDVARVWARNAERPECQRRPQCWSTRIANVLNAKSG